jgi:2-amino-4-hydroxy-6-hydroxymethyldihydropteridine diphosphokinase
MSKIAYLSLGSNLGDKISNLKEAVDFLQKDDRIKIVAKSSFYDTAPVGYLDQDAFVNIAIKIITGYSPFELLEKCFETEKLLKRKRIIRWGPRTIDVDILLYEDFISEDERLIVPHPRMEVRGFVLVPLCEIDDGIILRGKNIEDIIRSLDAQDIRKIENEKW